MVSKINDVMKKASDSWHKGLTTAAAAFAVFYGFGGVDITLSAIDGDLQKPELCKGVNDPNYRIPIESALDTGAEAVSELVDGISRGLDSFLNDDPSMRGYTAQSDSPINPADPS